MSPFLQYHNILNQTPVSWYASHRFLLIRSPIAVSLQLVKSEHVKQVKKALTNIFLTLRQPVRHSFLCAVRPDVYSHSSVIFKSWNVRETCTALAKTDHVRLCIWSHTLTNWICWTVCCQREHVQTKEVSFHSTLSPLCLSVCHERRSIRSWIIFHSWPHFSFVV